MRRIIFVGLHFKPDTKALCKTTKTGKLISKIIKGLPNVKIEKTNLFNTEYFPKSSNERYNLAQEWYWTNLPTSDDIVVALGAATHINMPKESYQLIKVAHPASKRSHADMDNYVQDVTQLILNKLNT